MCENSGTRGPKEPGIGARARWETRCERFMLEAAPGAALERGSCEQRNNQNNTTFRGARFYDFLMRCADVSGSARVRDKRLWRLWRGLQREEQLPSPHPTSCYLL